ncbi:MAG TPA: biosynthetic-type acetolactate synthase large subunit [Negativicutes bacterium]
MKLTGAQVIIKCLLEHGVDTVFGYPGGQVIPLYNALYDSSLKQVLPVHEQGAIHAADGYARASGRTGVCIATSGPGATNIVTGLATAYMDSVPIIAITGQVPTHQIGRDSFQEIDIVSVTLAITKHSFQVTDVEKLPQVIRAAFAIANTGRSGPVLIDIPSDIQLAELEYMPPEQTTTVEKQPIELTAQVMAGIKAAGKVLKEAKRPVLLVGGGIIRAEVSKQVVAFAEKIGIPVVSTLMGLGGFPANHPQFLGLTGMHGHVSANKTVVDSDVVIAIGSRFSDRVTGNRGCYAAEKTVIHIEIDPSEVDKNIAVEIPLVGDIGAITDLLTAELTNQTYYDWCQCVQGWREQYATHYETEGFNAPWIMHYVSKQMQEQPVIFVTDVGQNQLWAAQHLTINQPRTWITPGGCGTMGFGLPAALGAQLAVPASRVIHIAGDGGFKMTGMELVTVVNEQLPLISIVLNNRSLGMVRQWQQLFYQARYSATLLPDFDFVGFVTSCGAEGATVNTKQEFQMIFEQALSSTKPFVIIVNIATQDIVTPMIAPGAKLNEYVDAGCKLE